MTPRTVPRALAPVTLTLCAAGAAVSGYLTLVHYTSSVKLACSATGLIDCQKVTTSPQSMAFGVPVALLGVIFFLALGVLCLPAAWRSNSQAIRVGRLVLMFAGALMVVHLIRAELFEIDAICLWCTAVHGITVALFITVLVGEAIASQPPIAVEPTE